MSILSHSILLNHTSKDFIISIRRNGNLLTHPDIHNFAIFRGFLKPGQQNQLEIVRLYDLYEKYSCCLEVTIHDYIIPHLWTTGIINIKDHRIQFCYGENSLLADCPSTIDILRKEFIRKSFIKFL